MAHLNLPLFDGLLGVRYLIIKKLLRDTIKKKKHFNIVIFGLTIKEHEIFRQFHWLAAFGLLL